MVFYWVRKDFWLLHYWYQRFPQHPLLILNHLRSLQAPAILINNIYFEQKLSVSPGSDATPLMPNLTDELRMAKEQHLNQFGTAVLVWCGKSVWCIKSSNLT